MQNITKILLAFVITISAIYNLQPVSAKDKYKISEFNESYDISVDVSGSILTAFLVSGSLTTSSPDALFVYLTPKQKKLNISLVSIDGRYSADVAIEVSVNSADWVHLNLPSTKKDTFKQYKPNELVAFAYADSRDKRNRYVQEVFPVSWGKPDYKITQFYVNSAGFAPNYTFLDINEDIRTIECDEIAKPTARAYNHVCKFDRSQMGEKVVVTFSPDMDSSGKKYIIWTTPIDGK
jgi:hypothetical protein